MELCRVSLGSLSRDRELKVLPCLSEQIMTEHTVTEASQHHGEGRGSLQHGVAHEYTPGPASRVDNVADCLAAPRLSINSKFSGRYSP